jgi:autotransporter-associated beta strand protein
MNALRYVFFAIALASSALAQSWVPNGGGSWNDALNWHTPAATPDSASAVVLITNDFASTLAITLDRGTPFTVNKLTYDDLGGANDVGASIGAGSGGGTAGLIFAGTAPTVNAGADLTINTPVDLTAAGLTKSGGRNVYLNGAVSGFSSLVYNSVTAGMLAIGPATTIDWTTINKTAGAATLRLDALTTMNLPAAFSVSSGELQLNPSSGTFAFTNTAGFTKTGAGNLRLTRDAVGPGGSATLQVSGGILALNSNLSSFASGTVANSCSLQANAVGTYGNIPLTLTGIGTGNNQGSLFFNNTQSATVTWPGAITLAGNATIASFGVTYNTTLSGGIGGTGNLTLCGRGGSTATHTATFTLGAASSYIGSTVISNNDGIANMTVKLGVNDALPTGTTVALGIANAAAATGVTLDLNGKSQQLAGLSKSTTAAPGKYRIVNSSATAATLTLNLATATAFDGALGITGSANFSLVKQGNATLTLSGTNSAYSGGTTVSAGTLLVNSSVASGTGNATVNGGTLAGTGTVQGGVTVNSGGTLAGTLTVQGGVTVNSGGTLAGTLTVQGASTAAAGALLQPAGSGAAGTLTFQNTLALNGSALTFDMPSSGANDQIVLTGAGAAGDLALSGANTLTLNFPSGPLPAGTYTLMTYASQSGTGTLTLDPAPRNATLNVGATSVTLNVSAGGTGLNLTWGGGSGNLWDINNSAFWNNGGGADVFFDLDSVLFNDAGSASPAVDLTTVLRPTAVVVSNVVNAYTFSGAGAIAGAGSLTKWGTNTLTLATANTYSGPTVIRAGRLAYGVNDAIGAGNVVVTGSASTLSIGSYSDTIGTAYVENGAIITGTSGSLIATGSFELRGGTVSAIIAGASVVNVTTNTSTLSAANTYTGVTTVGVPGTGPVNLNVNHPLGLGSTAAGTTVLGGTTLSDSKVVLGNGIGVTNETITLDSGSGLRAGLRITAAGTGIWDGNVVLAGTSGTYLGADNGGGNLVVGGSADDTITGTAANLFFRGAGTISVNSRISIGTTSVGRDDSGTAIIYSTNNVWANTSISQGTLKLGSSDVLPATTGLSIGKGSAVAHAALDLNGNSQTVASLAEQHNTTGTQRIRGVSPSTLIINTSAVNNRFGTTGSSIDDAVTIVKSGTGTLTLTGTNTTSGAFIVSNGLLAVSATGTFGVNSTNVVVAGGALVLSNSLAIADSAAVRIADGGGAKLRLAAGVNESVGTLFYGENAKQAGTYGAPGSGATFINSEHFDGTGMLTVLHGYGGTLLRLY